MLKYISALAIMIFGQSVRAASEFTPRYYENFVVNGRRLDEGSRAARMASELAEYRGRHFTQEEFAVLVPKLLKLTHDSFRIEGRNNSPDTCFAGDCRILTPTGYRAIKTLRPGDDVYSIDVATGELIDNQVAQTFFSTNKQVGELRGMGLDGASILGTGSHPYFSPTTTDYQAVGTMSEKRELLGLSPMGPGASRAILRPVRRGPFYRHPNLISVHNLHLRSDPNNFCMENLVVHNMMVKF